MTDRLRLGVIGAGSWAVASHLPELARRPEVEFVAVSRKGPEMLERVKERFGFRIASEDYREVIDAGVDICLVSSPSGLHYEHAKAALEAGAHVLVEKPVTIEPAHAWELVDIADRSGLHLVCSFGWNYRPMLVDAKRLYDERGIGTVEQLVVTMSSTTRELLSRTGSYPAASSEAQVDPETWTNPALSGGGYGQAQLSHALGLGLWLTGLRGASVFALMARALDAPVELYDACAIRFSNGAVGVLSGGAAHAGFDEDRHQLDVRIIGSEGQFLLDLQRPAAWHFRADSGEVRLPLGLGDGDYDCVGPPNALVDLALGRDVVNRSPGWLGAHTVEILDAAYRSAAAGTIQEIAGAH